MIEPESRPSPKRASSAKGRYVILTQTPKNTLTLTPVTQAIAEFVADNGDHLPTDIIEKLHPGSTPEGVRRYNVWGDEQTLHELLDDLQGNGWTWVDPAEISALTDAPILEAPDGRLYYHDRYAVESAAEELILGNTVSFDGAEENEEPEPAPMPMEGEEGMEPKMSRRKRAADDIPPPDDSIVEEPEAPAAPSASAPKSPAMNPFAEWGTQALIDTIENLTGSDSFPTAKPEQEAVGQMADVLSQRPVEQEQMETKKAAALKKAASWMRKAIRRKEAAMDSFTRQYIETALWSSNDESTPSGGIPLDRNYSASDIDPATLAQMVKDCEKFQSENAQWITDEHFEGSSRDGDIDGQAGHDFWLTRNDHGAGFWDGDWTEEAGEALTKASKAFGEFDLYVTYVNERGEDVEFDPDEPGDQDLSGLVGTIHGFPLDSPESAPAPASASPMMAAKKKKCDSCNAAMINGVFCHEAGCPNARKKKRAGDSYVSKGEPWKRFEDPQVGMTVYIQGEMTQIKKIDADGMCHFSKPVDGMTAMGSDNLKAVSTIIKRASNSDGKTARWKWHDEPEVGMTVSIEGVTTKIKRIDADGMCYFTNPVDVSCMSEENLKAVSTIIKKASGKQAADGAGPQNADTGKRLEGDSSLPRGAEFDEDNTGITVPPTELPEKVAAMGAPPQDPDTGKHLEGDNSFPRGAEFDEDHTGVPHPSTTLPKDASVVSTASALKLAETIAEKLQDLYMQAKPITRANESRPVRDAVESIYEAMKGLGEAIKILTKQERSEAEEEVAAAAAKKKSSLLNNLKMAEMEPEEEPTEASSLMASLNVAKVATPVARKKAVDAKNYEELSKAAEAWGKQNGMEKPRNWDQMQSLISQYLNSPEGLNKPDGGETSKVASGDDMVYVYQADLVCKDCGDKIRAELTAEGKAPEDPENESSYDSDDFPKGPYGDGGGESDSPQHCADCGTFLMNPLTDDGEEYVRSVVNGPKPLSPAAEEWSKFYEIYPDDDDDDGDEYEDDDSLIDEPSQMEMESVHGQQRLFSSKKPMPEKQAARKTAFGEGTYEGYKNRETWNVMLTLNNNRVPYERYMESLAQLKGQPIQPAQAKAIARQALGYKTDEGISLQSPKIDWNEVAQEMMSDMSDMS